MARIAFGIVAFLLLLTLPTCRSIEQGTVRASTEEGYYHIFVHAYENDEGLPEADIIEFFGDSIESPPVTGFVEVTVEELHEMGYKTADEALADSAANGVVGGATLTMPDGTHRDYDSWLEFGYRWIGGNRKKYYIAGSLTRSELAPVRVWLRYELSIWHEGQLIHHWGPWTMARWNVAAWQHYGHYNEQEVHTYHMQGWHWWVEQSGTGLYSDASGTH
jgi:hypothetical protein